VVAGVVVSDGWDGWVVAGVVVSDGWDGVVVAAGVVVVAAAVFS